MKILICTGIYPPDIGGPAEYAKNIVKELEASGHNVSAMYYQFEKKMWIGIRHIFYFLKILPYVIDSDFIIALDTFSVGFPAVLAAKLCNRKIIVRVAGDFLWENYIENGGQEISLKDFYIKKPELSLKQRMISKLSQFVFSNSSALVFSTDWQKKIIETNYFVKNNLFIIENYYGPKLDSFKPKEKNYIFAGRAIKLKNIERLKAAFNEAKKIDSGIKLEIFSKISHEELLIKIQSCYAVILPSLSDISPNFILDAIRANKPFILTKETGLDNKLGDVGLFIEPFNKNDIKEKVLFLVDDKNYLEYVKKLENFNFTHSWKEIVDEFLEIYKKL